MTATATAHVTSTAESEVARIRALVKERRFAEGVAAATALLCQVPENRDVLYLLALGQRQLTRTADALATLDQLERFHPGYSRLYQERGHCYVAMKDAPQAIQAFLRAVTINPALPASWGMLEGLYRMCGDADNAGRAAAHVAKLKTLPQEVITATGLFSDGDLVAAEKMIRAFLLAHGDHIEAMRLLARIGAALEVFDDAELLLEAVLERFPDYSAARYDYASVLLGRHKHSQALIELDKLLGVDPANREYRTLQATAAVGLGDHARAITLYEDLLRDAPPRSPNTAELHLSIAHSLKALGRQADAIGEYRAATRERSDFGDAYWSLANLKTYRFMDAELESMRTAEAGPATGLVDRYHLCFALGKAYEDRGEYAESWGYYERGNALKRAESRYRPEVIELNTANQKSVCTRKFFEQRAGYGVGNTAPIFVVGLPRSGSTLIEQILASHSAVEGTQELADIPRYVLELQGRERDFESPRYPGVLAQLAAAESARFAEKYLDDTSVYRTGKPRFVDKMPNNFRHIGFIHLMFPNAKIIDARREPMACCFGNLKQLFARGQEFSYSIEDIARYYRTYLELMEHWDAALPGRVLRVHHEDVVDDLERSVRLILEFCELPFEPACVEFHRTERSIRTASSEQVRQPIFREGLDQWRNFEAWLGPLREALGDALVRYRPQPDARARTLRQNQGRDALAALESASRSRPGDAQVHHLLGQALEENGLLERAAESFGRATVLNPEFADAHNDLGEVLLRLGRTDAAIASCQRALALRPRFAAALGNLANAERARGALAAAIAGYRRVIALEPGLAEAHRNLGSALLEAGDREAAIHSLQRAIELRPEFARAVTQLARALTAAGRGVEAIPHYERLLARDPRAETLDEYAALLAGLGRYEASARCYRDLLERTPRDARLHANLGHVLHCLGDFRAAIEHCQRAIELGPRLPEAHLHLGNSLLALNALYEAEAAYGAGLEIAPDHAALHTAHAMAERALGRLADAEASTRRALALRPDAADTLALLGSLAIDHGRFDEAEDLLRKALAMDPELPEALVSLAAVRKMSPADVPWRDAAEHVLARDLPVAHAINLHHALGKYYDDVDDPDAAFQHHRSGNELARASRPGYDRAEMTQRVTRTLAAFDRNVLAALRSGGLGSERPVFVVGMPRSGTSLTEQILASHPEVHGAGELLYWIFAADAERAATAEKRAATIAELGRGYLEGLSTQAPDASRVVDKLPVNFRNIGLIHAALPGARFIHLERNSLDTCLSIYFQGFSAAHPYATDFGDLAHYYREYRRLMAHWRAVLPPDRLIEVRYEDLVDDPEGWSRRMLAHIGLPWDPRCLEFHRTDRPVLTASNWQVRQPMSKGSVDRWRRYERFIGPLREALGDDALASARTMDGNRLEF